MRRIGISTSGEDCRALNATMRGVAKSLYNVFDDVEIIGFEDGYEELMYADYRVVKSSDSSGILTQGGTILGTSHQSFKLMRTPDESGSDKVETMKHTYKKLKLSCLIVPGRNGNQKTANMLSGEGLDVVSLPKTIGNDLQETDMTFGSQSVVDVAINAIDCIHTTAASHGRVFVVEVMGHKMSWLTLYASLAGKTDVILLPEIPYDIDVVCNTLAKRSKTDKQLSILAVAEGAISREDAKMNKKELKEKKKSEVVYPSVAYEVGTKVREVIDSEVRVMVLGHIQRGDEPCSYDRVLAIRLGAAAVRLIAQGQYGYVVAVKSNDATQVPLSEVAGRLKTVDPECSMIKEAKMVSIGFDDE